MAEPEATAERLQQQTEELVAQTTEEALEALSVEDRAKLENSVLFPSDFSTEIKVLGKTRQVSPLPIKAARLIHNHLKPLTSSVNGVGAKGLLASVTGPEVQEDSEDHDMDMLETLISTSQILAEHYGWDDVSAALVEENITISDLQVMIVAQNLVQKNNDFLLIGLRILHGLMQYAEIATLHFQSALSGH